MDKIYDSETGCCPRFDPKPWDRKTVVLKDRLFLHDGVWTLFRIPLDMGKVIVGSMEKIVKAGALPKKPFMLYKCAGLGRSDLYIEVSKEVPGAEMKKISGTFLTMVFEGPYKDTGKWVKEINEYAKSKGKKIRELYFFYTTCPHCAEVYGKNYTVILAEI